MKRSEKIQLILIIGLVFLLSFMSFGKKEVALSPQNYEVTVYRDMHGIPHLYADNEEALFYAIGYVRAEDQIRTITYYVNFGKGTLSQYEEYGEDFLEHDIQIKLSRYEDIVDEKYEALSEQQKRNLDAFVAGINQYIEDAPDLPDDFVKPLTARDILMAVKESQIPRALERIEGVINIDQNWLYSPDSNLAQHLSLLGSKISYTPPDFTNGEGTEEENLFAASNALVVSGSKTSTGNSMAYFEPHLSMLLTNAGHREPYAMHVNLVEGDETIIDVFGLTDPQMPGLDEKFGRTTVKGGTSNSANDFEVYNETLNGINGDKYWYAGEWHDIRTEEQEITYWDSSSGQDETINLTFKYTSHGPIVYTEPNQPYAYSAKFATAEDLGVGLNILELESVDGVKAALQNNPPGYGNHVMADNTGDIFYVSGGKYPLRNQTIDQLYPDIFDKPIRGDVLLTEWQEFHTSLDDYPQIYNPDSGFIENCNDAPQYSTLPDENGLPYVNPFVQHFPNYILKQNYGWLGQRGRRLTELVNAQISQGTLSFQELKNIALDDSDLDAITIHIEDSFPHLTYTGYLDMIDYAFEQQPSSNPDVNQAINMFDEWDGSLDKDSTTAVLYLVFKQILPRQISHDKTVEELTSQELDNLRNSLINAVNFINSPSPGYGGLENLPTLGDITILDIGGNEYHMGLGNSLHKLVGSQARILNGDYTFYKNMGAIYTIVIELSEPPRAFLMKPYPQNENSESSQNSYMPQKFADNEFVEVYFALDDIEENLDPNIEVNPYILTYDFESCGDGECNYDEDCESCEADCGSCEDNKNNTKKNDTYQYEFNNSINQSEQNHSSHNIFGEISNALGGTIFISFVIIIFIGAGVVFFFIWKKRKEQLENESLEKFLKRKNNLNEKQKI